MWQQWSCLVFPLCFTLLINITPINSCMCVLYIMVNKWFFIIYSHWDVYFSFLFQNDTQKLTFKETAKPRKNTGVAPGKYRPDSGIEWEKKQKHLFEDKLFCFLALIVSRFFLDSGQHFKIFFSWVLVFFISLKSKIRKILKSNRNWCSLKLKKNYFHMHYVEMFSTYDDRYKVTTPRL